MNRRGFYERYGKRLLDVIGAAVLFTALLPVLFLIGLLVHCFLGSPVLFYQERSGKDGRSFQIIKFRSMTEERDADGLLKSDEERLTRFGRMLRSSSLDELPELINIIRGNMSFVGPRPLPAEYLLRYNEQQKRRLEVRPGLTGLAQIKGRNSISWEKRFAYDLQYIEQRSFRKDVGIGFRTLGLVFLHRGIHSFTSDTMEVFQGSLETEEKEVIERAQSPERLESVDRAVRVERVDSAERAVRVERVDSVERAARVDRVDRVARVESAARVARVDSVERVENPEPPESPESQDSVDNADRTGRRERLIILGAGGHGGVVADIADRMNCWKEIAFLDDNKQSSADSEWRILGRISDITSYIPDSDVFVAIGDQEIRKRLMVQLSSEGASFPCLLHPSAVIGRRVTIGPGTVVMAGAVINYLSTIGTGCIINTGATIDHENHICDYVHVSPGAHLAGRVHIGESCWVGMGSLVIQNVSVTGGTILGAGSLVLKNISEPGTYIGMPVRSLQKGERT